MKVKTEKSVFLVKQAEHGLPWIRKQPEAEQPVMQLPLPTPMSETQYQDSRKKDEDTQERGIWTIDI